LIVTIQSGFATKRAMQRITPAEKGSANNTLEKRLWARARVNSGLTPSHSSQPVLGLGFLRFGDSGFLICQAASVKSDASSRWLKGEKINIHYDCPQRLVGQSDFVIASPKKQR